MPPQPLNLVNLENVTKAYGTRVVLDGVSLGVAAGDRIGVVGRNGGGKSTLLRMLARAEPPDSGRATHTAGLTAGRLEQHDDLDSGLTIRQAVLADRAEHEWAGDPRARDVVTALLAGLDLDKQIGPLSGGERRRVALAALLLADFDLLLLDEPTNHLDVEGIDWLARYLAAGSPAGLAGRDAALVVVTHDRWFLDAVCSATWEVSGGNVYGYDGGYSAYVLAKAERARMAASDEARRANLLRKELAWLRRGPPARTSKPKFRIAAAEQLIADEPPARDRLELASFATRRLGKTVYQLESVSLVRGERALLDDVTWQLGPGDRVGLVGVNGAGKTSLLRMLLGDIRPDAGRVVTGRTVRPAYLSQEVAEIDSDRRVLESVEEIRRVVDLGNGRQATASQLLERFGFAGERQWTRVGDLSGGERRRLQLLRLLMDEPNVLLLDEPTNDLDIDTLTVIEDLLDSWAGSLVVVSHDRWFLERVTDSVVALLGDGRLLHLPGGVTEYLDRRRELAIDSGPPQALRRRAGDSRLTRKELARVERELDKLDSRERRLHEQLAAHATDPDKVITLDADLRQVVAEKERLEDRWLELSEEL